MLKQDHMHVTTLMKSNRSEVSTINNAQAQVEETYCV
jgi:hypothetical protein